MTPPPKRPTGGKTPTKYKPRARNAVDGVKGRRSDPREEGRDGPPRSRGKAAPAGRAEAKSDARGDSKRGAQRASDPRPTRGPRAADRATAPAKPPARPRAATVDSGEGRIAKLLARAGVASRREIERMIEDGRIAINGAVVTTPATILTTLAGVTVDGKAVAAPEATRLFLFHKPIGVLTAERDFSGRRTIYDLLPADGPRLMPIGRLDLNTEGLLLLTNDGAFKRQMELPATGVERTYRARAFGHVTQDQLESLIHGISIDGVHYARIDANLERRTGRNQWIEMTLTEGKNREVRRVLEHLGLEVSRLIRTRYGPFTLGDSAPGAIVEIAASDLARFRKTLG